MVNPSLCTFWELTETILTHTCFPELQALFFEALTNFDCSSCGMACFRTLAFNLLLLY